MAAMLFLHGAHCCCYMAAMLCHKGKVKVKFTLEQATKTQRGSRGITLLFL
jgi:hypothetical protein